MRGGGGHVLISGDDDEYLESFGLSWSLYDQILGLFLASSFFLSFFLSPV